MVWTWRDYYTNTSTITIYTVLPIDQQINTDYRRKNLQFFNFKRVNHKDNILKTASLNRKHEVDPSVSGYLQAFYHNPIVVIFGISIRHLLVPARSGHLKTSHDVSGGFGFASTNYANQIKALLFIASTTDNKICFPEINEKGLIPWSGWKNMLISPGVGFYF